MHIIHYDLERSMLLTNVGYVSVGDFLILTDKEA